ncbi:hypothetical protein BD410DRAFT_829910 [Rickenella mellea]|uniref:Uncharacterized protein n=1 Tax=Rickenella mellea TaxID=50990 RepID=A0A4Y7PY37_9AGAM|nr:hypothetical protein BD410DRAFT_829910 [Rickenella mellea]
MLKRVSAIAQRTKEDRNRRRYVHDHDGLYEIRWSNALSKAPLSSSEGHGIHPARLLCRVLHVDVALGKSTSALTNLFANARENVVKSLRTQFGTERRTAGYSSTLTREPDEKIFRDYRESPGLTSNGTTRFSNRSNGDQNQYKCTCLDILCYNGSVHRTSRNYHRSGTTHLWRILPLATPNSRRTIWGTSISLRKRSSQIPSANQISSSNRCKSTSPSQHVPNATTARSRNFRNIYPIIERQAPRKPYVSFERSTYGTTLSIGLFFRYGIPLYRPDHHTEIIWHSRKDLTKDGTSEYPLHSRRTGMLQFSDDVPECEIVEVERIIEQSVLVIQVLFATLRSKVLAPIQDYAPCARTVVVREDGERECGVHGQDVATKRMTAEMLLVRVLWSCEKMANASVVCTDKTGTPIECDDALRGIGRHTCEVCGAWLLNGAIAMDSTAFEDTDPDTGTLEFVGSKTETTLVRFANEMGWAEYGGKLLQGRADDTVLERKEDDDEAILTKRCTRDVGVREDRKWGWRGRGGGEIAICYMDFQLWPPKGGVREGSHELHYGRRVFRQLNDREKLEGVPRLQVLARSLPEDKKIVVDKLEDLDHPDLPFSVHPFRRCTRRETQALSTDTRTQSIAGL